MVSPGMRRYRTRTADQASLVGPEGTDQIDLAALFGTDAPPQIRLEIGFGHGEFLSDLAAVHPDEHFVGVEYDRLRVTKTAHKCLKSHATNVRLFADEAYRFVARRLPDACCRRIYILFPDPWPKLAHRRRRLVNLAFLREISRIAAPGCRFGFSSDTHGYACQVATNLSLLPGLWRSLWPELLRIDVPNRFPTVFERHKREEGCTIAQLRLERTALPLPPRIEPPAVADLPDDGDA